MLQDVGSYSSLYLSCSLCSAEQYLKDAEDEVTVTVQMRSLANK